MYFNHVKGGKRMEKTYLISDAAKQVQVETHVLRYWEEELELPIKRNKLGHRYYTLEDVEFFKEVKKMKDTGLQLKAIRMYMKDGQIIPGSIVVRDTPMPEPVSPTQIPTKKDAPLGPIVPPQPVPMQSPLPTPVLPPQPMGDPVDTPVESREEKSLRLQYLLRQFIKEAVQDSNQEMFTQVKDTILKEMDYQFRNQEELAEKREENRIEREEKHFRQIDDILRRKNRRRNKG